MLNRSVPFYKEMQRLLIFACNYLDENDKVYDLGCSASTLIELSHHV